MKMDNYTGVDAEVPLESIDASIALRNIYENIELLPLVDVGFSPDADEFKS